ncbi:serine/arginine repetitive matrix protein 1-like [Penaeus indicus]|uniref:serine/arginine repetitive matrix protein 1-like n=1 Tax=Penaeus indicus TaxID=29960 RepID=UPI00300D9F84
MEEFSEVETSFGLLDGERSPEHQGDADRRRSGSRRLPEYNETRQEIFTVRKADVGVKYARASPEKPAKAQQLVEGTMNAHNSKTSGVKSEDNGPSRNQHDHIEVTEVSEVKTVKNHCQFRITNVANERKAESREGDAHPRPRGKKRSPAKRAARGRDEEEAEIWNDQTCRGAARHPHASSARLLDLGGGSRPNSRQEAPQRYRQRLDSYQQHQQSWASTSTRTEARQRISPVRPRTTAVSANPSQLNHHTGKPRRFPTASHGQRERAQQDAHHLHCPAAAASTTGPVAPRPQQQPAAPRQHHLRPPGPGCRALPAPNRRTANPSPEEGRRLQDKLPSVEVATRKLVKCLTPSPKYFLPTDPYNHRRY